jgi:hypothetical protein
MGALSIIACTEHVPNETLRNIHTMHRASNTSAGKASSTIPMMWEEPIMLQIKNLCDLNNVWATLQRKVNVTSHQMTRTVILQMYQTAPYTPREVLARVDVDLSHLENYPHQPEGSV